MVASNISPDPKPAVAFWNRPWVQNVLPLATSLLLHVGIIVLGVALYQAVKQAANPNRDQVVIPQMQTIAKANIGFSDHHMGLPNLPALQPAGISDSVESPMLPAMAGRDNNASRAFEGSNIPGQNGAASIFGTGPAGKGAFTMPGGDGLPGIKIISSTGNGRTVAFLCDASGSMLTVFGRLKQELKQSINNLDVTQGQEFNVVFFSDANYFPVFQDGMHLASPENEKIAMNFIDDAVCTGGTLPIPAINFAMSEKPDLVFVLTDGFDQIANFDDVEKAFKTGNNLGKTHINCIFLQADEDPKLEAVLKQISTDGHGVFTKILKSDL